MSNPQKCCALTCLSFALLIDGAAQAAGTVATNVNPFQATDNQPHNIPLTNNGLTTLSFSGNGRLVIAYNAECLAQGPDASYLSISILIDGQPTNPKVGTDFAFCSATGLDTHPYVAGVRNAEIKVGPGQHTVEVVGTGINTSFWQVDDSTLTISK